jgi:hypothetical protein
MQLVKIDNVIFINIEKVCGLRACSDQSTYILTENNGEVYVEGNLYKVKKIIEDAMKEK